MPNLPLQKAPAAPQGTPAITGTSGLPQSLSRPMTVEDVRLLQNRRSELSRQLNSATGRRSEVVREMGRNSNGREGLEARLKVLDERIVQLEKDISQNGQLLASAPPNLVEETQPPPVFIPNNRPVNGTAIGLSLIFVIGLPMVITWCLRALRRPRYEAPQVPSETTERIARIENAVDSIALEVERISEGQRFITRLMSEGKALGAGAMQPVVVEQAERQEVRR